MAAAVRVEDTAEPTGHCQHRGAVDPHDQKSAWSPLAPQLLAFAKALAVASKGSPNVLAA
jgi:hypothetical protein